VCPIFQHFEHLYGLGKYVETVKLRATMVTLGGSGLSNVIEPRFIKTSIFLADVWNTDLEGGGSPGGPLLILREARCG